MPPTQSIIAITGVAGYLGSVLARLLNDDPRVDRIVGVDCKPPNLALPKLEFNRLDINDPRLAELFRAKGVTHIAHLAFYLAPNYDRIRTRRINVGGSENVLKAAVSAKARQVAFASSSVVYGAKADNPIPIPEDQPLRPTPQVQYTLDKIEVEGLCRQFRQEHREINVSVLRAVTIVGPGVDNFIVRALEKSLVFQPRGFDPPWQFIHELDAARAFQAALLSGRSGVYNLGADESIRLSEIAQQMQKPTLHIPRTALKLVTNVGWYLRLKQLTEIPGALIDYMCYPPVLCNDKIKEELGFQFQFTSREAIGTYLQNRSAASKNSTHRRDRFAPGTTVAECDPPPTDHYRHQRTDEIVFPRMKRETE